MNNKQNNTNNKFGRVLAVPRLCELYPGICLTTEEKAVRVAEEIQRIHIIKTSTHYKTHPPPHTHTHTHTHITKQFKTTTVQIKTNTVQDIPKLNIGRPDDRYPKLTICIS
jgi:hypothetical protein